MDTGAKTSRAWQQWEGQIVDDKFPLLRYLAGNEHGATFLTERPEGEPRTAAIKIRPADPATAQAQLARWKASSALSHPHLVRLFEMGQGRLGNTGFAYLLMEYAEEDLSHVDRPLSEAEMNEVLEGTVHALAYLHSKRLAHGHLKPSNILAVSDQLKISNDTIRPSREWRRDLDDPERCAPPEILQEGASPAGDVWSLGMTIVEALTKRLPSSQDAVIEPSLLDALPAQFHAPVLNCLRRDPQQRWTTADFAAFLQNEPEPQPDPRPDLQNDPEPTLPSRTTLPRPERPWPRFLLVAGALAVALAAAIIVPQLTTRRAEPALLPEVAKQLAPVAVPPKAAVVREEIIAQVLPDVPAKARNTIRGKVALRIRVKTDANGSVIDARNESPSASRYFGHLALQAARQWKFTAKPQTWSLRFQFVRDASHPVSVQAVPSP